jgi:hypothetical protein
MSDGDAVGKHITEALGGSFVAPLSHEERVEVERVTGFVKGVKSCYFSLFMRETDPERKAAYEAEMRRHEEVRRRIGSMTPQDRQQVLRTYPPLLRRLQAEIDG